MAQAFIGLGSNLEDREANLRTAVAALRDVPFVVVRKVSRFIETLPQGGPPQPKFLNAAAELSVEISARQLLEHLLRIEAERGRARAERWGPRTLDLDLLLYNGEIICEPDLQVPHPRLHERLFVLQPLAEIAPKARHPILGKTIGELLEKLLSRPAQTCLRGSHSDDLCGR